MPRTPSMCRYCRNIAICCSTGCAVVWRGWIRLRWIMSGFARPVAVRGLRIGCSARIGGYCSMIFRALARGTRTHSRLTAGVSSLVGCRRFSMLRAVWSMPRRRRNFVSCERFGLVCDRCGIAFCGMLLVSSMRERAMMRGWAGLGKTGRMTSGIMPICSAVLATAMAFSGAIAVFVGVGSLLSR